MTTPITIRACDDWRRRVQAEIARPAASHDAILDRLMMWRDGEWCRESQDRALRDALVVAAYCDLARLLGRTNELTDAEQMAASDGAA